MKHPFLLGAIALAGAMCLPDVTLGHGGTYRGPGDTVPPGGGAPPGGGTAPPASGPGAPSTPAPGAPSSPAPSSPGSTPAGPGATGPTTGNAPDMGPDLTLWNFWWGFNKEPYLNLRNKVRSAPVQSSSDEFFLGRGEQKKAATSLRPSENTIRTQVVPALKTALETEEQNDIVTGCLIALAKIGDVKNQDGSSEFVDIFTGFLKAGEQEIQETAALALGILADDRSIPALVGLMKDDDVGRKLVGRGVPFRTRAFSAYGLGLVGYKSPTPETRRTIAEHLVSTIEDTSDAYPDVKVGAVQALGLLPLEWSAGEDAAAEEEAPAWSDRLALIDYLTTKMTALERDNGFDDFRTRAQAPIAIARLLTIHDKEFPDNDEAKAARSKAIDALLGLVDSRGKNKNREVRQSATTALGMIANAAGGDKDDPIASKNLEVFKELERIAKDAADPQTEYFALIALAQMGSRPGTGDAPRALQAEVQDVLLRAFAKGKGQKRPWAGLALGVFGNALNENDGTIDQAVYDALRQGAKKYDSPVEAGAYAIGLGLIGDQNASDILLKRLDEMGTGQEEVRGNFCVGLGLMEASEATDTLNEIVKASKFRPDVLQQAAIGLGLLGDKTAVPLLLDMLKDAQGLASQAAIATALGTIGDASAVEELVKMLAGETDEQMTDVARGFAAVALGITCDKEDFPWNTKIAVNTNYRANVLTLTSSEGTGILDIL